MKLRDFLPPVLSAAFASTAGVAKSALSAAFIRGQDVDGILGGAGGKLIEPYAQSAWVNRAISLKVDEIVKVPVKFYDGDNEFDDAAFLEWWQEPFLTDSGRGLPLGEVRRALASWPDLAGEFFILLGDDWIMPFAAKRWTSLSRPVIARPDRMRHVVSGGKVLGWVFTDAGARQHTLLPEQVIHSPEWNPYDDFRGLATLKVVLNAAEAEYLATLYVRNLMRNNGDQGVYVVAKGGLPGDEQREQIVAALREKRAKALRGEFSPVFLTGDITIEDPKAQATDASFNSGRPLSREEIFTGLRVPPSLSTVKASYSIGADSDRFALITGSSQPLAAKVDAALSRIASIMTGRKITAETEWDEHPVLQHVRRERIDTALKLWASGMAWREVNSYLDLGMKPFQGWQIAYVPFSIAPVSGSESAGEAPGKIDPAASDDFAEDAGTLDEEDDQMKGLRLLVLARQRAQQRVCTRASAEEQRVEREFAAFACTCGKSDGTPRASALSAAQLAQWRTLVAKRRATRKAFETAFGRVLMQARVETLKKIEAQHIDPAKAHPSPITSDPSPSATKAAIGDLLFSLEKFAATFRGAMESQHKSALQVAGEQLLAELEKDDVFKAPPSEVLAYLQARANKLRGVPDEVYARVKAEIEAGLKAGDTTEQLAGRVKTIFNGIADGQARLIASTETGAAYGAGRQLAMKQAGVQFKAWLTSGNANVRPAHEQAGLDYPPERGIPVDEPFIVDGEALMHPGDDAGSAGNVINCHCVSIAVRAPEET